MVFIKIFKRTFTNEFKKINTMKLLARYAALLTFGLIASCSTADDAPIQTNEKGKVQLFFDPTVKGDQLLLGTSFYKNSLNERLKINRFNFIVSNIRLTEANGTVVVYPKNESYFIIDSEKNQMSINLEAIPAGNYTHVTFGLGVDQEKYLTGETDQQEFWDLAATHNMTWSWITGYKFINFEGVFTAEGVSETPFKVHIGSHGTALDNYKEVTLALPNSARVRGQVTPSIHIMTDINQVLDGGSKVSLKDNLNPAGTTASIMVNANLAPKIMQNATQMFVVDHVHNSGETH